MSRESGEFSWYRPRILTLIVLIVVAAPIVVANLSHDEVTPQAGSPVVWPPPNPSYGWPLIWYSCQFKPGPTIGGVVVAAARMNPEIVQWSWPRLAANLAIWLVILAVAAVVCEWPRRRYCPEVRFYPRVVTVIVLIVVAVPIVLANLSQDGAIMMFGPDPTFGWPLIWRWRNVQHWYGPPTVLDENYSAARLAGNVAMWLAMLAFAGGACEWLLWRHRPRLRWSLRTMLAAVGLAAVCCAWFAAMRHRANLQDPIISTYVGEGVDNKGVYLDLERWGPRWLDLVGLDRFRRRVVGATMGRHGARHEPDEELFRQLERLPGLRYFNFDVRQMTTEMVAALANMRQLRILRVSDGSRGENDVISGCLEAIGKLAELEELHLLGTTDSASLAHLAGLTNLKSLTVTIKSLEDDADWDEEEQGPNDGEQQTDAMETGGVMQIEDEQEADEPESGRGIPLFEHLPALPRLETIDLRGNSIVDDEDLRRLAILPRLKSLNLSNVDVSDAGLANFASLNSLEELAIGGNLATPGRLESLLALKHLKALHIVRYTAVTDAVVAELPNLESHQARYTAREGIPGDVSHLLIMLMFAGRTYDKSDRLTTLALDHGDRVYAFESEVEGLRSAFDALRQSNPSIVIDSDPKWFDPRRGEKRQKSPWEP